MGGLNLSAMGRIQDCGRSLWETQAQQELQPHQYTDPSCSSIARFGLKATKGRGGGACQSNPPTPLHCILTWKAQPQWIPLSQAFTREPPEVCSSLRRGFKLLLVLQLLNDEKVEQVIMNPWTWTWTAAHVLPLTATSFTTRRQKFTKTLTHSKHQRLQCELETCPVQL